MTDNRPVMLHKENRHQQHQGRESGFGQDLVDAPGGLRPASVDHDARQYRKQHQQQILFQQIAHRQRDSGRRSGRRRHPPHDQRDRPQSNQAAQRGQQDRQSDIAPGHFGKDIRRTAARRTGDQHQTDKEHRRQMEKMPQSEGYERQQDNLACQRGDARLGAGKHRIKITEIQSQAQTEHQDRQNRQDYPNRIHRPARSKAVADTVIRIPQSQRLSFAYVFIA